MAEELVRADVEKKVGTMYRTVKVLAVTDQETYEAAADCLKEVKGLRKVVADFWDPTIASAHKTHKDALSGKKKMEEPLVKAEGMLKQSMGAWAQKQEKARQEEQARLQDQAKKQEEERRLAEAQQMEDAGDHEAAAAHLEAPLAVPPVVLPKAAPKVEGVSIRKTWTFTITNPDLVPREFCSPDQKKIRAHVEAHKAAAVGKIDGVKVWEASTIAASGRDI